MLTIETGKVQVSRRCILNVKLLVVGLRLSHALVSHAEIPSSDKRNKIFLFILTCKGIKLLYNQILPVSIVERTFLYFGFSGTFLLKGWKINKSHTLTKKMYFKLLHWWSETSINNINIISFSNEVEISTYIYFLWSRRAYGRHLCKLPLWALVVQQFTENRKSTNIHPFPVRYCARLNPYESHFLLFFFTRYFTRT